MQSKLSSTNETSPSVQLDSSNQDAQPLLAFDVSPKKKSPPTMITCGIAGFLLIVVAGIFFLALSRDRLTGLKENQSTGTALAEISTETGAAILAVSSPTATTNPATDTPLSPTAIPSFTPTTQPAQATTAAVAATSATPDLTQTPAGSSQYRLAFYSNRENEDGIYLMDPDNPESWRLLTAPDDYEMLAWPSFCGDELAFEAADRSLNLPTWVFLYNLTTSQVNPLELPGQSPQRATQPGCSSDGQYMSYTAFRPGRWSFNVLDRKQNTILMDRPAGEYSSLGFATWLTAENLFYWMGTRASGYYDIIETDNLLQNPPGPSRVVAQGKYPAVSPDGSRLVSFCGNMLHLCMVERKTGKLLFEIPVSYFKKINQKAVPATAAWSADGKWLYYSSSILGNWDIFRMRPDGSQVQNLTESWTSDEYMPAAR